MKKMKNKYKFLLLIVLLIIILILSLFVGTSKMSILDCINGLFTKNDLVSSVIMHKIRLPRVLGGLLAGIGLSVSGVILQSITNNSLSSPNIIGVNSGAGLFTIIMFSLFPSLIYFHPIGSFLGAFLTSLLIISLSNKFNNSKSTIVLAGIAISTLFNGLISFITLIDTDLLTIYKYFSIGGLSGINMKQLLIPFIFILLSVIILIILARKIEIFSLGDELSKSLGINIKLLKTLVILLASILAGSVVSYCGLLGFVGLVVPHIVRKIINGNLRENIFGCIIIGSIIVLIADIIGRIIIYPSEIPLGIVMAFIGSPFFLYLLLRRRKYA